MFLPRLSDARSLIWVLSLSLLVACSTTPVDPTAKMSPDQIYAEAKESMSIGAWDKAIPLLEKLEGRAAGTLLAQQAQLDRAYAHFRNGEQAQSVVTLDRFIRLHPASPALDYALYLKGTVNFNDDLGFLSGLTRMDLSERDQKAARESFDAYRQLVTRFPQSRYTPDARLRMGYIVNSLAQYEVHVARYYFSRGAYLAAINRSQAAVQDYSGAPAVEEALAIMAKAYDALQMTQLRDDSLRVLEQTFPDSAYLAKNSGKGSAKSWWKLW